MTPNACHTEGGRFLTAWLLPVLAESHGRGHSTKGHVTLRPEAIGRLLVAVNHELSASFTSRQTHRNTFAYRCGFLANKLSSIFPKLCREDR